MSNDVSGIKNTMISGAFWLYAEKICAQGLGFVVSIILARLLLPEQYGVIAIVTIFITLSDVFITSGLGTSLIQKKDADEADYSTAFIAGLVIGCILYSILFFIAPWLAVSFHEPLLTDVFRVMGLKIILASLNTIQRSYVQKHLLFKKFFLSTIVGTMISSAIGIYMAYAGYGVWALVTQNLLNVVVDSTILLITLSWRPTFVFSFQRLKGLLNFGSKMFAASMISEVYNQSRSLVVGRCYSSGALALYDKGAKFPTLIISNINQVVADVLFPTMSQCQDDVGMLKTLTKRSVQLASFVLSPFLLGLAIIAPTMVSVLMTDKWLGCVPYIQILSVAYLLMPLQTANIKVIQAIGLSGLSLKLEVVKKVIGISVLILAVLLFDAPIFVAISFLVTAIVAVFINMWPNKKLIQYGCFEQVKDFLPSLILSAATCSVVWVVQSLFGTASVISLITQILVGVLVYVGLAKILRFKQFDYVIDIFMKLIKSKRH